MPSAVWGPKIDNEPRTLRIATAVAREHALATHVRQASRLVELTGDRLEPMRALRIHFRIHELSGSEARQVTTRVLAGVAARHVPEVAGSTGAAPLLGTGGALRRLFQRLRGRRDPELRRLIEMWAAETEVLLVRAHARHALRFWELFGGRDDEAAVVDLYLDAVQVPDRLRSRVRALSLERLAALRLPREPHTTRLPQPAGRDDDGRSARRALRTMAAMAGRDRGGLGSSGRGTAAS